MNRHSIKIIAGILLLIGLVAGCKRENYIVSPSVVKNYVLAFNQNDEDIYAQAIPNSEAADFLEKNIPRLDYPDKALEEIYYFRWWTYRKHIKSTPDGFVITEFLPQVPWSGKYNTISCPAAHHFREGRWLHDAKYLNDYAVFWLRKGGEPRRYTFCIADSYLQQALVTGNDSLVKELLPDLVANFEEWEKKQLDPNGLFYHFGDRDGGEFSAAAAVLKTDEHYRIKFNSEMAADAFAISQIARRVGDTDITNRFQKRAEDICELLHTKLWDSVAQFYKVAPRVKNPDEPLSLVSVREIYGFCPWYFEALNPPQEYTAAWEQLTDPNGFYAEFGPTTAEQRHPAFGISYEGHECLWNGPSWPFSTSFVLTALANLVNKDAAAGKDIDNLRDAYLKTLACYVRSHRLKKDDGKIVPWIDENINPYTGDWISRTRLKTWKDGTWSKEKGGYERGKDYNHSTFCDQIINGLIGFRPSIENKFEIFPLVPSDIPYFALDDIRYHGKTVAILYDKDGKRYRRGKGFHIYIDGKEVFSDLSLPERINLKI